MLTIAGGIILALLGIAAAFVVLVLILALIPGNKPVYPSKHPLVGPNQDRRGDRFRWFS